MTKKLPFALPDIGEGEIAAVAKAMRNNWITSGVEMRAFEQEVQCFLGSSKLHCLALNSATAGLHLALCALDLKPEDEVIVPAITFVATAEVVAMVGAKIVLSDVCAATKNVRLVDVVRATSENTKALMLVHYAGSLPAEYDSIIDYCQQMGIKVIEDAAHSFGASRDGKRVGNMRGWATVFSFYATKCITTGEGGMLVTEDPALADRVKALRLHGISRDVFDRYSGKTSNWEYDVTAKGYKCNMTDMAAAMGRVQLTREAQMHTARKFIAKAYEERLPSAVQSLPWDDDSAFHLYPIAVPGDRNQFMQKMYELGVTCSMHFKPLYRLSAYAESAEKYPNAEAHWQSSVSLPMYSTMTLNQVQQVVDAVKAALEDQN